MRVLALALLLALSLAVNVAPDRCSPLGLKCVGEGQFCDADSTSDRSNSPLDNIPDACNWATTSICRICTDATLACAEGVCIKRSQGVGDGCDSSRHEFCLKGLACDNTLTCVDPNVYSPTAFAQNGDDCKSDSDCYNNAGAGGTAPYLYCDVITQKCRLPTIVNDYDNECADTGSCPPRMWCASSDGFLGRRCKPREKLPAGSICEVDEQCELGTLCVSENPLESNPAANLMICRKMGSRAEGETCNSYSTDNPAFECKEGQCVNNWCVNADDNTLYLGCASDSECGRGMTCACNPGGAGRMRCTYDGGYVNTMFGRKLYGGILGDLAKCMDTNGCQFLAFDSIGNVQHLRKGSCTERNCNGVYQKLIDEFSPSYDDCPSGFTDPYKLFSDYLGMDESWNSASQHAPVLAVLLLSIATLFFAMH